MTIYIIVKRAENWVIGISQDLSTPNKRGNNGGEAFDNDDNDDNDDDGDDDYDDDDFGRQQRCVAWPRFCFHRVDEKRNAVCPP